MKRIKKKFVLVFLMLHLQLAAQLISIKSVPVATGDQFMIFPSRYTGMGGVSIALPDPLADPFFNPLRGRFLTKSVFTASPVYYKIADDNGSARTIPLTIQMNNGKWFGGGYLSAQDLDVTNENAPIPSKLSNKSLRNVYTSMYFGIPLKNLGITLGASAFYAALEGMDDESLMAEVELFGRFNMPGAIALAKAFEHQTHHRGQTTIYLRLAGVTPPGEKLF